MVCPLCSQRKARRACPALGQTICPVCCATKRLVEIACPQDCPHLVAAKEHPAAIVKRQQERDVALLMPTVHELTERQHQLFFLMHTAIARHSPDGFARLNDDDVAAAAAALASTFETSARGVIYEHAAESPVAQRLAADLKAMLGEMEKQGARVYDHEVATVLRAIERGAREMRRHGDGDTRAYLSLLGRLLQVNRAGQPARAGSAPGQEPSSIVLP